MKSTINRIIAAILMLFVLVNSVEETVTKCFAENKTQTSETQNLNDGVYDICLCVASRSSIAVMPNSKNSINIFKTSGGSPREKFFLKYDPIKQSYSIRSMYSGGYLGIKKGNPAEVLALYPQSDEYYEEWVIKPQNQGYSFELKTDSGKLMGIGVYMTGREIQDGSPCYLTDKVPEKQNVILMPEKTFNGVYEVTSPALCQKRYSVLDAASVDPKTGLSLKAFLRNGYGTQKFCVRYHSETDDYEIMSLSPRMFLGAQKDSEETAKLICKEAADDSNDFRWEITRLSDGYVKIRSKSTQLFLEVGATSLFQSTEIMLRPGHDCIEQKFMFNNICEVKYSLCQISPLNDKSKLVATSENGPQIIDQDGHFSMSKCLSLLFDPDDRCCAIFNPVTGKCIGTEDGNRIVELDYSKADTQKWVPLKLKGGEGEFSVFMLKSSIWTSPVYMYFEGAQQVSLSNRGFKQNLPGYLFNMDMFKTDSLSISNKNMLLHSIVDWRRKQNQTPPKNEPTPSKQVPIDTENSKSLTKIEPQSKVPENGLSIEDLVTAQPEFCKYKPYVEYKMSREKVQKVLNKNEQSIRGEQKIF